MAVTDASREELEDILLSGWGIELSGEGAYLYDGETGNSTWYDSSEEALKALVDRLRSV